MTDALCVGIDFGTTNSALAISSPHHPPKFATFELFGQPTEMFRSVLYFSFGQRDSFGRARTYAGPQAIETYLEEDGNGRLIISPKSSLASALFDQTQVLYDIYKQEDLVALVLRHLRQHAEAQLGPLGHRAVVGRPVHFAGAKTEEDEERALQRLRDAFTQVGFTDITFEYEPVAAASSYESNLEQDELVLVADFGGGTTDFCIIRVGPNSKHLPLDQKILATDGVGIAGDSFDSRMVRALIAPAFGMGTEYRSSFNRTLPTPVWPYSYLDRWYTISFLSEAKTTNMLHEILRTSLAPKKIRAFLDFIEGNLGLQLYQAIEAAKMELSQQPQSLFSFRELPTPLEALVKRARFERWIEEEIEQIDTCCQRILDTTELRPEQIDRVFLTGGSSFVPRVRQIFLDRFGEERIGRGRELTSVATGLALRAQQVYGSQS